MDDIQMYMDNLDEYIYDENKVVTYKWLSITLQIPCNFAKRILYHYMTSKKEGETKDDLHVTYFVMGTTNKSDGQQQTKVHVVPSAELETVKECLESVVCVHVYSLSKSSLKDQTAALYTTDYSCVRENLAAGTEYGGIECPAATRRSDADIASLRKLGTYKPSTPQDTRSAPDPRLVKPDAAEDKPVNQPVKPASNNKSKTAKSSLASMFATQNNVKKETKENTSKNDAPSKNNSTEGKKGGISNFFTKGANPRDSEVKKEPKDVTRVSRSPCKAAAKEDQKSRVKIFGGEKPPSDEEEECQVVAVKKEKSPQKSIKKDSPRKSISNGRAKGKVATQPRRSRILQMDSDSSEEEGSENESDNECPVPSPPASPRRVVASEDEDEEPTTASPPPKITNGSPHRGKKRKLVDKTYEEDGYLLTRKEYVYVTDSESEDPAPSPPAKKQDRSATPPPQEQPSKISPKSPTDTKRKGKKAAAKKPEKASPTKTKQASIMSFFKKK